MVDVRRKFDLYVALRKVLHAELAACLVWELEQVERTPSLYRRNHERFRDKPAPAYSLYEQFNARIGREHTVTMFEMLDPIGWAGLDAPDNGAVAAATPGGEHGR